MSYVILIRDPSTDQVLAITNEDDRIQVFQTIDAAREEMRKNEVCSEWPCEIVEAP